VANAEADKSLANEVQNVMHGFHLLYFGCNKIITIPVVMSDKRIFYRTNHN